MNVILDEEYKEDLIIHFSSAIKQVQMEQLARQSVGDGPESHYIVTNNSSSGQILCSSLEMILMHGLKERKTGYWEVVRYFCRNDVVQIIKRLKHVKTDLGRGRAWIFIALNENELEGYLQSFVMDLQHMHKYYQRYAMICSSQVSVLQTLISGLEYVKFQLHPDVPHLDFRILTAKTSARKGSVRSGGATHIVDKNRGSVVHIDATPLTELASKGKERASSFIKDHFRRESNSEQNVSNMPMKVIADHSTIRRATAESVGGCHRCAERNALICLCAEKDAEAIPNAKQEDEIVLANGYIPNEIRHSADKLMFVSPVSPQERFNPFDKDVGSSEEYIIMPDVKKESLKRFDKHVAISDTPIEVVHKPRRKLRKKRRISDSGSESSAKSEERAMSHEIIYSPMLDADDPDSMFTGADPDKNVISLMNFMKKMSQPRPAGGAPDIVDSSSDVVEGKTVDVDSGVSCTDNVQPDITTESLAGGKQIDEDSSEKCNTTEVPSSVPSNNMCNITIHDEHCIEEDQKISSPTPATGAHCSIETAADGNSFSNITTVRKLDAEDEVTTKRENNSLLMGDSGPNVSQPCNMMNLKTCEREGDIHRGTHADIDDPYAGDESETPSVFEPELTNADAPEIGEVNSSDNLVDDNIYGGAIILGDDLQALMEDERKTGYAVSSTTVGAYGEYGFDDSSKSEAAVISMKCSTEEIANRHWPNPNLDIGDQDSAVNQNDPLEEATSITPDCEPARTSESQVMLKIEAQVRSIAVSDDMHGADYDTPKLEQVSQTSKSVVDRKVVKDEALSPIYFHETFEFTDAFSLPSGGEETVVANRQNAFSEGLNAHPSVVDMDNNLKLHLLIEVLKDESETIIKLFHLSTGHSEGCWAALYLLFTDCFIYFMRNGDGKSPFQVEHLVSYEDLDYISTAYCGQAMQFVFYEDKPSPAKGATVNKRKLRTKVTLDTADEHLTAIVIMALSNAFALFAKQRGVVKCPPVFHDSKDHELLLRKYVQSEGLSGEIDLYILVHWEDPDSAAGEDLARVTKEGPLEYKTRSFWGSAWKVAHFALSSGILYQYKSKETDRPDAIYDLKENKCVGCKRVRSNSSTPSLEFEVIFQDEKLDLRGPTDAEVTDWLQHLCLTVALKQASDQTRLSEDGRLRSLSRDALVPCSLIVSCETMLLFHEDPLTGFCRTLAKAGGDDLVSVHFDRGRKACEITAPDSAKWAVFFAHTESMDGFENLANKFARPPITGCVMNQNLLSHFEEGRSLLDNRWTRPDNLLKGRNDKDEYIFI